MAVKGTDLVKLLPKKTGCKECGFPTCFAFAMKLATGGAKVSDCPYLSDEVREKIEDLLAPPIRPITIGTGDKALLIGDEEVIYRHEKTFFHPPGIGVLVSDTEDEKDIARKIKSVEEMEFIWIGRTLKADLVVLRCASGEKGKFVSLVKKAAEMADGTPLVLMADKIDALLGGLEACGKEQKPLLYAITEANIEEAISKLGQAEVPVAVKAEDLGKLSALTEKLKEAGIQDLVVDPGSRKLWEAVRDQIFIRRAAIKQGFRALGYPTITFPCLMADDPKRELVIASALVTRYAGIIVLSDLKEDMLFPLVVLRLNIYTDPRVPMAVESKIYEINQPTDESPVLLTTNFALTYFSVANEIEATKVPAYLAIQDTEGLSVLTSWSAGKFNGETAGEFIKKSGIEQKTKNRKIVIPGVLARIRGELEDELPGWEVVIGPREAAGISSFLPELVGRS
ncbi:MAG: acetyl-CoA decarbonylase/synthase complex subunit gamma [Deltaproteobacteria bacterium]|nr:MAG: acetyl-CoA decarbonylase/synthase complex subunit gamma [Deltaproteobacteria bacterium]